VGLDAMKKIVIIIVLLLAVFIFRARLLDISMPFFNKKETSHDWVIITRNKVYNDLNGLDFKPSLDLLDDFSQGLKAELGRSQYVDSHERGIKRYVICELAVVYEKMALLYLHNDSYEKYIEFLQKSRERLTECAREQNIEDGA